MKTEEPANLKWNQHPVISAVLWILGTDTSHPHVSSGSNDSDKAASGSHSHGSHLHGSHNVLWKDEHGGSINEYFNQIQTSQQGTDSPIKLGETKTGDNMSGQNPPHNPLLPKDHSHPHDEHDVDTSQSPQWGFYVSITPPQQEMFGKQQVPPPAQTINSIQADQRKRQ